MTGLHLAQYRIDAELGRGGMGVVYRARDTKLDRTVALKVLPAMALGSEGDRARFLREAKAAAQLSHPNVCHVYQVDEAMPLDADGNRVTGQDDARLFIAMEFIEGETLAERIAKGPLRLTETVIVATQVAEALRAAHAKDIVHRDIKSANVMLTQEGVAKVLDFGLAKTAASTMLTRHASTVGTVAYMSPEQARGEEVDSRTDLYSLGTMLYEMVSGRLPFAGDYEQAVVYGILNEEPEPLTGLRTGVPMELERIATKLLSKNAARRYQTAADLIADLGSVPTSPAMSRATGMPPVTQAARRYRGSIWTVLLAVGVGVAAGVSLSWLRTPTERPSPVTRHFELGIPEFDRIYSLELSPDGSKLGVVSDPQESPLVVDLETGERHRLDRVSATGIRFSPDSRRLVAYGPFGVMRARSDGSDPLTVFRGRSLLYAAWVGDETIAVAPVTDYFIMLSDTGQPDTLYSPVGGLVEPERMLDEWRVVCNVYGLGAVVTRYVVDLRTREWTRINPADLVHIVASTGHALFEDGEGLSVAPVDMETFEAVGPRIPLPYLSAMFSVSADGTLVYEGRTDDASYELIELQPDGSSRRIAELTDPHFDLAPDGKRIVGLLGGRASPSRLAVVDVESGLEVPIGDGEEANLPVWGASGERVYYRRALKYFLSVAADRIVDPVVVDSGSFPGGDPMAIHRDGRRVAWSRITTDDNFASGIQEWDLETGSNRWLVEPDGLSFGPVYSPEGRLLLYRVNNAGSGFVTRILDLEDGRSWVLPLPAAFRSALSWRRDDAIEYAVGDSIMAIPIDVTSGFRATGAPRFIRYLPRLEHWIRTEDGTLYYARRIQPDGPGDRQGITLNVIVNWFDELESIAPHPNNP